MPIGAIIGAVGNAISTEANNAKAQQREDRARRQNYQYGEMAANEADARTRSLYNDLYSPEAQMKQLKAAGLSPSIYSSSGIAGKQGQSGAQGNGANISPNVFAADPIGAAMATSQMALNKAQARKLNAEANTEEQTGINKANAEIKKLYAETIGTEASTLFTQSQTEWQNLMNEFKNESWTYDMTIIQGNAQKVVDECTKLQVEIDQAENDLQLSYQTFWTKVAQEENNLELTFTQILNNQQDFKIKEEQIKQIQADVKNTYYQMSLAYSRFWQDEKRLNEEIKNIKNNFKLECKKYNLELHRERHQTTNNYLNTLFEGIGTILHGATLSKGQTCITTSSTYRNNGVRTTVTETTTK